MRSESRDVREYLASLPEPRGAAVALVCERLRSASEAVGLTETFQHGMPFFTQSGEQFIAVASQKHYVSLYVAGLEETLASHPALAEAVDGVARGKSCLRFRESRLDRVTPEFLDSLIEVTNDWIAEQAVAAAP